MLAFGLLATSSSALGDEARSASIDVTLVGGRSELRELERLLVEWNPTISLRRAGRVSAREVLEVAAASSSLGIWVVLSKPELTRIYFTDPSDSRYFVREVPLTNGLDEAGREILTQVITNSAKAFLERRLSSSPAEVEASLRATAVMPPDARDVSSPTADLRAADVRHAATSAPILTRRLQLAGAVAPTSAPTPALWSWNIGLTYTSTLLRDRAIGHGPGGYWGITRRFGASSLGLRVSGHYRLPVEQRVPGAVLLLRSWALGFSTELTRKIGDGWTLGGALGVSIERTTFGLSQVTTAAIEAEPEDVHYRPSVVVVLPCARDLGGVRWAIVPGLQLAWVRTHYDISARTIHEPWLVQPRVSFEMGWDS